jgi:hypothetical protein
MADIDHNVQTPTVNTVVRDLVRLNNELRDLTAKLQEWERKAAEAKVTYAKDYALAYLQSEGTVDERKCLAVQATAVQLVRKEHAISEVKCYRAEISAQRLVIDSARSAGALLRAEMQL